MSLWLEPRPNLNMAARISPEHTKALSLYKAILRRVEHLKYTDKAYVKKHVKIEFQNGRSCYNIDDIQFQLKVHLVSGCII